jgi:hypothetical protein
MLRDWIPSFLDEMNKVASLDKKEKRNRALRYAAVGAVASPFIRGASNLIEKGRIVPESSKPVRWLLGSLAAGTLAGTVPSIRKEVDKRAKRERHGK